jgi:hypothetical protein
MTAPTPQKPSLDAILARNPRNFGDVAIPVPITDEGTGLPTGLCVNVFGRDSAAFRAEQTAIDREANERRARVGGKPYTADERTRIEVRLIAAVVTSANTDGWPADRAGVEALLTEHEWIRNQLDAAIADRARFMQPPKSS